MDNLKVKKAISPALVIIYSGFKNDHSKRTIKGTLWRQEETCNALQWIPDPEG